MIPCALQPQLWSTNFFFVATLTVSVPLAPHTALHSTHDAPSAAPSAALHTAPNAASHTAPAIFPTAIAEGRP